MKRLVGFVALFILIGAFAFATGRPEGSSTQPASRVIRLGHIRDVNSPTHLAAMRFKEIVEKSSGGRITVQVFPNSQLGDPIQMFAQMQSGDLDMVYGGIQTLTFIKGGEPYEITAIAFLFNDYQKERKVLLSDFFKPTADQVENKTGIKIVNINGDTAPRGLTTANTPVHSASDLDGLKIRVAQSELNLKIWRALGSMPQVVPYSDLYMALKTGVVEAQENGAIPVMNLSLYEVQKYYIKTDYSRDIETFYMGLKEWNSLPQADRDLIYQATEEAGNYETELNAKQLKEAYDFLKTKMTVIENPNVKSMRDRLMSAGIYAERAKAWTPGIVDYITSVE